MNIATVQTTDAQEARLWHTFARNVRDNVIAEAVTKALRVSAIVILARRLEPAAFGVFRILLVVCVIIGLLNQAGIPEALIQRSDLRREHEATAWWISIGLAHLNSLALYVIAPLAARTLAMPELTAGMRMLCIPLIIEGAAATADARFQRELRFGALALADILSESAFLVTALFVLKAGHPEASLPAALSARCAIHGLTIRVAAGMPVIAPPKVEAARDFARFASTAMGAQIICFLSANTDYLLVGRLLGSTALGYYSIAWDLLRFIPDRLYRVAGRVSFPTFCRFKDDDRKLGEAYLRFFGYIARIVLPLIACLVIAAPEVFTGLYGAKWIPAVAPLRLLGIGLAIGGLNVGIGAVYYAKSRPALDFYLHGVRFLMLIAACTAFARFGLRGVSAAMAVEEGIIGIAGGWGASKLIDLPYSKLALAAAPAFVLAGACAGATFAAKMAVAAIRLHGAASLLLILPAPIAVFLWSEGVSLFAMARNSYDPSRSRPSPSDLALE